MVAGIRSIDKLFEAIIYENPKGEEIVRFIKQYKKSLYENYLLEIVKCCALDYSSTNVDLSLAGNSSFYRGIFELMMDYYDISVLLKQKYDFDLLPYLRRFDIQIGNKCLFKDFIEKYQKYDCIDVIKEILLHSLNTFVSKGKSNKRVKIHENEKVDLLLGFLHYMNFSDLSMDDISNKMFQGKKKEKIKQVFSHMKKTLIIELGKVIEEGE